MVYIYIVLLNQCCCAKIKTSLRFVDFFMNSTRWPEEEAIIHTRYGENIELFSITYPKDHQVKALPIYHLLEKYFNQKLYQQKQIEHLAGPAKGFF